MKTNLWHRDFSWNDHSFDAPQKFMSFVDKNYPELSLFINEWFSDSGLIHVNTSGSTGQPKRIALRREHMINSALATGVHFQLGAGSTALLCLPLEYIAGRMMLIRAMLMGWKLHVIEASSSPYISKERSYDFAAMVPLQLHHSLKKLQRIKTLIVGGGKVPEALRSGIMGLSTKIYATYGMTETITHVALSPLNRAAGYEGGAPVFKALDGIQFSTDNRDCLVINAPNLSNNLIYTNDVVRIRSNTSFEWLARYDHVINSGGLKLFPEVIEKKIEGLIKVPFFLGAQKDDILGERMVLIVEQEASSTLLVDLKNFHRKHPAKLSALEIPKEIYFMPSFCYTETGKIQRELTMQRIFDRS